jgi:hypothetical protein
MNDKQLIDPDFLGLEERNLLKGTIKLEFGEYSLPGLSFDVEVPASSHRIHHLNNQNEKVIYNVRNKNKLF